MFSIISDEVNPHELFSMNNQNMMQSVMQEPTRMFYIVLEVSRWKIKTSGYKGRTKKRYNRFRSFDSDS